MHIFSALNRVASLGRASRLGVRRLSNASRQVRAPGMFWRLAILSSVLPGTCCFAAASVSPAGMSWASVAIGNKGGQKVATLTNGNTTAITISSIAFSGANPADFTVFSKTCGSTLAAGTSCTVNIVFGPTATGTRTATLNFNDSDAGSPQTVTLTGLGTAPSSVAVSPSSLSFAGTAVGSSSGSQSVVLANGLSTSLSISGITITGTNAAEFAVAATTCGAGLAASANCSATIVFKPTGLGTRAATLRFTDSAANSPQSVALTGTGLAASSSASVSPTGLSFPDTSVGSGSASQSVTLSNGAGASITLSSIAIAGANAADFTISGSTCFASLAASASCSITVVFHPSAPGTRTANLIFTNTASNSPQTVTLSGTGVGTTGNASVSPASISWSSVAVGNRSGQKIASLTNRNTTAITISSITFSGANPGDFAVLSKTCGSTLAAGASCTVNIVFGPTATGSRTAALNFNDSDSGSPQAVSLTGLGAVPTIVNPSSLSFGTTAVGSGSASQSATLTNKLVTTLTIGSVNIV